MLIISANRRLIRQLLKKSHLLRRFKNRNLLAQIEADHLMTNGEQGMSNLVKGSIGHQPEQYKPLPVPSKTLQLLRSHF
jgi:hypothetical protein